MVQLANISCHTLKGCGRPQGMYQAQNDQCETVSEGAGGMTDRDVCWLTCSPALGWGRGQLRGACLGSVSAEG